MSLRAHWPLLGVGDLLLFQRRACFFILYFCLSNSSFDKLRTGSVPDHLAALVRNMLSDVS